MKTLSSVYSLRDYGINPLTGEACGYAMRTLCDLTEQGKELVSSFLGLPADTTFQPNWNSSVGDAPAVASVMLTRSTLRDLMYFALRYADKVDVIIDNEERGGSLVGLYRTDEYYTRYLELAEAGSCRIIRCTSEQPARNTHAFTGRIE